MFAFVPTTALPVTAAGTFCAAPALSRRSRNAPLAARSSPPRRAVWHANAAPSDKPTEAQANAPGEQKEEAAAESEEMPIFDDEIEEPYPGFFADMKRMGTSDEESRAQALKMMKQSKARRVDGQNNMLKPDGTSYAPWMGNMPSFDAKVIKKRTDATGRLAADPQEGELSGLGMQWKMLGDELELSWATGAEEGNLGFVVYRRRGKDAEWVKVSDYRDKPAELMSKGPEGGRYSFLVTDAEPGTWVYRVSDVDANRNVADLSQVLVEIESAEDSRVQKIALAVLLAVLALALAAGIALDPLSSA